MPTDNETKAGRDMVEDGNNVVTFLETAEKIEHQNIAAKRVQQHYDELNRIGLLAVENCVNVSNLVNNSAAIALFSSTNGFNQIALGKAEGTISPNIPGSGNMAPVVPNVNPTGNQQPGTGSGPTLDQVASAVASAVVKALQAAGIGKTA